MSGSESAATPTTRISAPGGPSPTMMLALATIGFLVNFWAWALISPLGATLGDELGLTAFQESLVVAVPVIVGSLGRVPIGALTDRYGARTMFPVVSFAAIVPVLFIGFFGDTLAALLIGGFVLGIAGTAFAVGVPHVNGWFAPERRGAAIGIFGMRTAGTAVSAFTTVQLSDEFGRRFPFVLVAVVLAVYGVIAVLFVRDAPRAHPPSGSLFGGAMSVLRIRQTWELSFLYAVGFGGFVAFSVYLPTYLGNAFELSHSDAAFRTAGFVILAVIARPIGGWLSDRFQPVPVLAGSCALAAAFALLALPELDLIPVGTIAFLGLAAALGAAAGACFALVAKVAPADKVGAVTGVVGAAGGLGGFFPPLVMGAVYSASGDYSLGFALLALTAAAAALYTWTVIRRAQSA
jgi:MFS transporter, NNP family, nitrate/nitrite transporter